MPKPSSARVRDEGSVVLSGVYAGKTRRVDAAAIASQIDIFLGATNGSPGFLRENVNTNRKLPT